MGPAAPSIENLATAPADPRLVAAATHLSRASSIFVICLGLVVLLGWVLDVGVLKSVIPGLATMKANTALCFVLAGAALLLLPRAVEPKMRSAALIASLTATVIGLLNFSEDLSGWNLGIDQLLFEDRQT